MKNFIFKPTNYRGCLNYRFKCFSRLSFIVLLTFSSFAVQAQNYFQQEMQQQQAYYDSIGVTSDTSEGGGYAAFQRTLFSWGQRLLPDKDYEDYRQEMLNYASTFSSSQNNPATIDKNWHFIGTNGDDLYGNNFTGQIHYVYFPNTSNIKYMFACSPTGGLFNSSDGGTTWQNAGTDKGLPRSGVSSICIDTNNYWYVTTGNGEGFRHHPQWQAAIGLYRSMDEGATWDRIGLESADGMRKVIEVKDNNPDSTWLLVTTTIGFYQSHNANALHPYWEELLTGDYYDVVLKPDNNMVAFASGSDTTSVYKINLATKQKELILKPDTIIPVDSLADGYKWSRRTVMYIVSSAPDYLYTITSGRGSYSFLYRYKISTGKWVKRGKLRFPFTSYGRGLSWIVKDTLYNNSVLLLYGKDNSSLYLIKDTLTDENNNDAILTKWVNPQNNSPHADCHYLYINPKSNKIWQGNDGGLYVGTFNNDTTITWYVKNKGLGVSNVEYLDVSDSGKFVTCGEFDNHSNKFSTTDGVTWISIDAGSGDGYQTIANSENDYFISAQLGNIHRYKNNIFFNTFGDQMFPKQDFNCNTTGDSLYYANWSTYYQTTNNYLYMTGQKEIRRLNFTTWQWDSISSFSSSNIYPELGCNHSGTWEIEVINDTLMFVSTYGNSSPDKTHFAVYKYLPTANGNRKWEWLGIPPGNKNWIGAIHSNHNSASSVYASYGKRIYLITWNGSDANALHNATWHNITYDLDTAKSMYINVIEQDSYGLYIGSDGGVFFKPNNEQHWYDYNGSLPNVEVKDLKISNNRLFAATYGRGIWYASAASCEGAGSTIPIKNDITYDNIYQPIKLFNTIFVENGVTMTVKTELQMGVNAKIIIDRGATLLIDGGTITHACPDLWPGVELRGNAGIAYQDTVNQGRVIIKNGGTIEYAVTGIKTIATFSDDDSTYYDDPTYAGGIILADSATFKNNHTDVWFFPYPKDENGTYTDNLSHFINTNFITDSGYYYFDESPGSRVILDGVRGIMFADAVFENTTSLNFTGYNNKGIGIEAWDAGYYAVPDTTTNLPTMFKNLQYGIKSFGNTFTMKEVLVDSCDFINNKTGCYLSAETFASVIKNRFVSKFPIFTPDNDTLLCGLYLDGSILFQVEENRFNSNYKSGNSRHNKAIGVVINNCGGYDNMIYNNTFDSLDYATIAQGVNRGPGKPHPGLQYKCNLFEKNQHDILVTQNGSRADYTGIAEYQGSADTAITAPAGNRFSQLGTEVYGDFDNKANFLFYHLPNASLSLLYKISPVYYTTTTIQKVFNDTITSWSPELGCPSHLDNKTKSALNSAIASNETNRSAYADTLDTQTDDGNTTVLNLDVVTSIPPETMQLRDQLLEASPYLSDTVMVNAAEKEDVLPNSIITEILSENPQSAKAENVLNTLNARNNPPNANQMAQIHANDTVMGVKEELESKLAYYRAEKQREVNKLVQFFMNDTASIAKTDSIEVALSNIQTPSSYYLQTFCRYSKGDSMGVINKLSDVTTDFDLDTYEADINNEYENFFDLLLELQSRDKRIDEVDSTQKAELYSIMQNSNAQLEAFCRNILIKTNGLEYHEPYILTGTNTNKNTEVGIYDNGSMNITFQNMKLYPNPARDYITIEYQLPTDKNNYLIITDIKGVTLMAFSLEGYWGEKIIDLRDVKPGVYVVQLQSAGKTLQTGKFVKH